LHQAEQQAAKLKPGNYILLLPRKTSYTERFSIHPDYRNAARRVSMLLNCNSHHGGICQQSPTDFAFSVGWEG